MKRLAVVILNYNGASYLSKFLPEVIQNAQVNQAEVEIVVIDNCSTDDSLALLDAEFPSVKTVRLKRNYGFAGGYNEGLKAVNADYYLLLNSDVELPENTLTPLVELMENNPDISACQPKILSYNEKDTFEHAGASGGFIDFLGYPFCRGRVLDYCEKDEGQYDDTVQVFWATGACILIRSEVFHQHGGFADYFFAHMEEIDLCWRINNQGGKVVVCPESKVYHVGGGSLPYNSPRKIYLNFRNNLLTLVRNDYSPFIVPKTTLRLILDGIAGLKFLAEGKPIFTWNIIKAHFSFYKNLRRASVERVLLKTAKKDKAKPFGIYPKSVVWNFFLRKKKTYTELVKMAEK
jgi:GT2 family glycosyltransferase